MQVVWHSSARAGTICGLCDDEENAKEEMEK